LACALGHNAAAFRRPGARPAATTAARRDLLEIVEDRYGRASTLLTSQLPVSRWHDIVGEPTLADTILDRIVPHAQRIELKGARRRARPPLWTTGTSCNPLDQTATTGNACNRRGKLSVPAGFVGIRGRLRSDQTAGFSRIQRPPHSNGHYDTDARDRTRKVGQTRSLIVSSSYANVCVLHDKV
jgi:hypothetical protein